MGPWIWFNLLLFSNGNWHYVNVFETLEACQEARQEIEQTTPGNYYCLPTNVTKAKNETRDAEESRS